MELLGILAAAAAWTLLLATPVALAVALAQPAPAPRSRSRRPSRAVQPAATPSSDSGGCVCPAG